MTQSGLPFSEVTRCGVTTRRGCVFAPCIRVKGHEGDHWQMETPQGRPLVGRGLTVEEVSMLKALREGCVPQGNRQLEAVREFQNAIGHPNRSTPSVDVPEAELRAVLVEEEAAEFAAAVRAGDLIETADAAADLLVVVYGACLCFGIPIDSVFEEIHRTNMLKADGPVRADGKRMKPPGWTPPDVAGVLAAYVSQTDD